MTDHVPADFGYEEEWLLLCHWEDVARRARRARLDFLEARALGSSEPPRKLVLLEAELREVLVELRSMLVARRAQPVLPMELEP